MGVGVPRDKMSYMLLHTAKQACGRRRDAPESEAYSAGLLRELNPGPLGPGARIIPLDQAAVGYAPEYLYAHTHALKDSADTVSCIDGMLEVARRNKSRL